MIKIVFISSPTRKYKKTSPIQIEIYIRILMMDATSKNKEKNTLKLKED